MERRRRRPSSEDATLVRAAPAHQLLHRAAITFGSTQGVSAWSDWPLGSAAALAPGGLAGSGQLGTPRKGPAHWAPSHCL
eukprot:scaffold14312_cov50-Phaeocystis_antarctica.AAC.2